VNQEGFRIQDNNINRLTVIANEAYEDFARQLQTEIEEDCGVSFKGRIKNKRERETVKYQLDEKFREIWDRIKHQTTYKVDYDTAELIKKASKALSQMPEIKKAVIKTTKTALKFDDAGIVADIKASYVTAFDDVFGIPDVLFYIQERTGLTRSTILEILLKSGRTGDVMINPQLFLDNAVSAIKDVLTDLMIDGIKYEKIGAKGYDMRLFQDYEIHINELTFQVLKKDKTIYSNFVPLDSNVEYNFARECESRDDIEFYFKLPFWFEIQTPIGAYNPDWALIKKNERTIYFVAETKSAGQELKPSERRKIKCGYAHFNEFEDVEYRQVSTVGGLD
jgi:type III restriction enzyme